MNTQQIIDAVGFRQDNTDGYTDTELLILNEELEDKLRPFVPFSDEWYQTAKKFADEVSRR